MKLSKRLQMNVSLVPSGARVADIGCDHGYAAIWLVQNQIAKKMIAMDINEGPIERAKEHIYREGLESQIECRRSNGLEKLEPGEVDTLMIAGMGGPLMIEILNACPSVLEQVDTLVLQPQSEIGYVRNKLSVYEFELIQEKACCDEGKYYFSMLAKRRESIGKESGYNVQGTGYSTYLIQHKDPVMLAFLQQEKKVYDSILERLRKQGNTSARRLEVEQLCTLLEELIARMQETERR